MSNRLQRKGGVIHLKIQTWEDVCPTGLKATEDESREILFAGAVFGFLYFYRREKKKK